MSRKSLTELRDELRAVAYGERTVPLLMKDIKGCSCPKTSDVREMRKRLGYCPEHSGAWSYKCQACWNHHDAVKLIKSL